MSRTRAYASNAAKQKAYQQRRQANLLAYMPQKQIGDCTLYLGDAVQIVPLLPPCDHVVTDPPYEAETHTRTQRTRAVLDGRNPYADIPFPPITEAERRMVTRIPCTWMLIFCQVEAVKTYKTLLGPKYRRTCVWVKPDCTPQMNGQSPAQGFESIVCAWGRTGKSVWNSGGKRGVYTHVYTHLVRDGEERLHSTQKPLPLMTELLRDFTQPGELILDPFMGLATTGVAAVQLGRRFVGIERDPPTFAQACRRIEVAVAQGQLFAPTAKATQVARLL
jgi:site-specific DNA-methyltransferase (adenine-specific)